MRCEGQAISKPDGGIRYLEVGGHPGHHSEILPHAGYEKMNHRLVAEVMIHDSTRTSMMMMLTKVLLCFP